MEKQQRNKMGKVQHAIKTKRKDTGGILEDQRRKLVILV